MQCPLGLSLVVFSYTQLLLENLGRRSVLHYACCRAVLSLISELTFFVLKLSLHLDEKPILLALGLLLYLILAQEKRSRKAVL